MKALSPLTMATGKALLDFPTPDFVVKSSKQGSIYFCTWCSLRLNLLGLISLVSTIFVWWLNLWCNCEVEKAVTWSYREYLHQKFTLRCEKRRFMKRSRLDVKYEQYIWGVLAFSLSIFFCSLNIGQRLALAEKNLKAECTHWHFLEKNLCFCNFSHLRDIHWKLCHFERKTYLMT